MDLPYHTKKNLARKNTNHTIPYASMVWSKSYTNFCMVWYGTACNLYGMVWVYAILLWEFLLILTENPKGVLSILNYFSKFRVITDFKLGPIILQKKWAAKFRGPYHTIPYTSMPYTCMPYLCMVWHGLLHTILAYGMVWPVIHVHTSVWRPCLLIWCLYTLLSGRDDP